MTLLSYLTGMSSARRRIFAGLLIAVRNGALYSAGAGIEPPCAAHCPESFFDREAPAERIRTLR